MNIDIQAWRSVIGMFYGRMFYGKIQTLRAINSKHMRFDTSVFYNHPHFSKSSKKLFNLGGHLFLFSTLNLVFLAISINLILLAGDVAENSGPDAESDSPTALNSLSILHLNIRSIRNKLDFIMDNFSDLDIFCFTEPHLSIRLLS